MDKLAFVHTCKKVQFNPTRSQSHPKLHHNLFFFFAPIKSNLKPSASATKTDKQPKSLRSPPPITTEKGITGLLEHHACVHLCPRAETFSLPPLVGCAVPEGFWRCSTIAIVGWKLFPGHQEIPHTAMSGYEQHSPSGCFQAPPPAPSRSSSAGAPPGCPPHTHPCVLTKSSPLLPAAQQQQLSSAGAPGCAPVTSPDTGPVASGSLQHSSTLAAAVSAPPLFILL